MTVTTLLTSPINLSLFPYKPFSLAPKTPYPVTMVTIKPSSNSQFAESISRRVILPSVSGIWDALTGAGNNNNARQAVLAIRRGMLLFRQGDVMGSLLEFDNAIELDPRQKAYLWQRGLSLYYLDRFEEGAEQFRIDVAQNPNDTEESIWCFLCEVRLYGMDEARKRFLEVGTDPRPVMRQVYTMFKDGGDPVKGETDAAKNYIVAACQCPYGKRSDDYMASLAKVHCLRRNWSLTQT